MRRVSVIVFMLVLSACSGGIEGERVEVVENEGLALELIFIGDVLGEPWDGDLTDPYIAAAERWLEVIEGVQGADDHTLEITFEVRGMRNALGMAGPDEFIMVGDNLIPVYGVVEIATFTYTADFEDEFGAAAEDEFNANILHEMGHVFGIGSVWNLSEEDGEVFPDDGPNPTYRQLAFDSPENEGPIYVGAAGTAAYNEVFGTDFAFMPVLAEDMAHVYSLEEGERERTSAEGVAIPPADDELMANGRLLSIITVGLLEDLGYIVNYDAADGY